MGRALTGTDAVHATSHTSSRRCHAEQREGRSTAVAEPCSFLLVIVQLWPAAAGRVIHHRSVSAGNRVQQCYPTSCLGTYMEP